MQKTDLHTEKFVDLPHPLTVARGKIVVHGDDVHVVSGKRIEIPCKGRNERFTFTGLHFGDLAIMKRHTADELHIEMTEPERAFARFSHRSKCLRQHIVKRFTLIKTLAQFNGHMRELLIALRLHQWLKRIDAFDHLLIVLQRLILAHAQKLGKESHRGSYFLFYYGRAETRSARPLLLFIHIRTQALI